MTSTSTARKIAFLMAVTALFAIMFTACSNARKPQPSVEVKNPVTEVKSFESIKNALGFDMVVLPEELAYSPVQFHIINKEMAEVRYENADKSADVWLRQKKGKEDISGIYGVSYEEENVNNISVNKGRYDNTDDGAPILVGWFYDDAFSYSASATGLDNAGFEEILKAMTSKGK